jgi:hypothetical protein
MSEYVTGKTGKPIPAGHKPPGRDWEEELYVKKGVKRKVLGMMEGLIVTKFINSKT